MLYVSQVSTKTGNYHVNQPRM